MAALLAELADDAVVVRPREEPIDLDAFCRRLQVRVTAQRASMSMLMRREAGEAWWVRMRGSQGRRYRHRIHGMRRHVRNSTRLPAHAPWL